MSEKFGEPASLLAPPDQPAIGIFQPDRPASIAASKKLHLRSRTDMELIPHRFGDGDAAIRPHCCFSCAHVTSIDDQPTRRCTPTEDIMRIRRWRQGLPQKIDAPV